MFHQWLSEDDGLGCLACAVHIVNPFDHDTQNREWLDWSPGGLQVCMPIHCPGVIDVPSHHFIVEFGDETDFLSPTDIRRWQHVRCEWCGLTITEETEQDIDWACPARLEE